MNVPSTLISLFSRLLYRRLHRLRRANMIWVVFFLLCAFVCVVNYNFENKKVDTASPVQKPHTSDTIVYLADFNHAADNKAVPYRDDYGVTLRLMRQLEKACEPFKQIKIERINTTITPEQGSTRAHQLGIEHGASLVLWGDYTTTPGGGCWVHTNVEAIQKQPYIPSNYKEDITAHTSDLDSFAIEDYLSNDTSYLILMLTGLANSEAGLLVYDRGSSAIQSFSSAIDMFSEAIKKHTLQQQPKLLRGEIQLSTFPEAMAYYWRGNAYMWRGDVQNDAADYKAAMRDYKASIKHHPSGESYVNIGCIFLEQNSDLRNALINFQTAHKVSPNLQEAKNNLFAIYVEVGNIFLRQSTLSKDKRGALVAIKAFDKAMNYVAPINNKEVWTKDVWAVAIGHGEACFELKNFTDALHYFVVALNVDPNDATCHYMLAQTYTILHRYPYALVEYANAVSLEPDNEGFQLGYAGALAENNQFLEAEQTLTLLIATTDTPDIRLMAYTTRAALYKKYGKLALYQKDIDRIKVLKIGGAKFIHMYYQEFTTAFPRGKQFADAQSVVDLLY